MSLARVITAVTAALLAVVASATSASASTAPDTWPEGDVLSATEWIAIFIGGTVLLFVIIWVAAAAANAKIRHHVVTPVVPPTGPEVEATHRMPLPGPADGTKH